MTDRAPESGEGRSLTVIEAEGLALHLDRLLDVADPQRENPWHNRERNRLASDLAGLRTHSRHGPPNADLCEYCSQEPYSVPWPCADARRYSDGLRRTAALYGVQE